MTFFVVGALTLWALVCFCVIALGRAAAHGDRQLRVEDAARPMQSPRSERRARVARTSPVAVQRKQLADAGHLREGRA